jgi:hypothetical protein
MEALRRMFDRKDTDARRKGVVQGAVEVGRRNGAVDGEGGDLAQRVDPGIGTTGALRQNRLPRNPANRVGQRSLDGREARLDRQPWKGVPS